MKDIAAEDMVTDSDGARRSPRMVECVRGFWAWVVDPSDPSGSGEIRHVSYLTKIEPFFEAGKTYRSANSCFDFECIAVSDKHGSPVAFGFTKHLGRAWTGETWCTFAGWAEIEPE